MSTSEPGHRRQSGPPSRWRVRPAFVLLHRWVGLVLAGFLVLEGLTGSLLAFNIQLTRLLNPHLFAAAGAGATPLTLAQLAERGEALHPEAVLDYFAEVSDDRVLLRMQGRRDPVTKADRPIGFKYLVLDPRTGHELGRLTANFHAAGFVANIMPSVYSLHVALALGDVGMWILGIVALIWTIDCFVGFYLTLPAGSGRFWSRWGRAWLVKERTSAFRFNFDLHRAGGLWFWVMLLAFAWSAAGLVERSQPAYNWVMGKVLPYQGPAAGFAAMPSREDQAPTLDWFAAESVGKKLLAQQAALQGFKAGKQVGFAYLRDFGIYVYDAETDRPFPRHKIISLMFDADRGTLSAVDGLPGARVGDAVDDWLRDIHMVRDPVDYLPYRILVCVVGLVVTVLSVTGVYIWWRKQRGRRAPRHESGEGVASAR